MPFILTQYAQEVLGWSPIQFGLASVVMPVTAAVGTVAAQAIATRGGFRPVAAVGLALTGLGCLLLTQVSVDGSYFGDIFFGLLLFGPGIGAAYVAGSIASLAGVAEAEAGLASGLSNASFQIGGAVGVAILSTRRRVRRARRRPPRRADRTASSPPSPRRSPSPRSAWCRRACCSAAPPSPRPPSQPPAHRTEGASHEEPADRARRRSGRPRARQLLVKEKELTRARDALAAERRRMPWMAVEKDYRFEGPDGPASLLDLFEGRRQLIVYRAFYAPDVTTYPASGGAYPERACVGCSFGADQVAHPAHLNARDTTLVYVSRAPQAEIQGLKQRMGWELIPWYTLTDDFDKDFGVDEWHGHNAFIREGDRIFRTYFIDARGDEQMGTTWSYLDITALGRQEEWEDSPEGYPQTPPYEWWNYHDAYGKERSRPSS